MLLGIVVNPFKADLSLSDTQMSIVSGVAFVLFNLLVGIFIAGWVDRGDRRRILIRDPRQTRTESPRPA